MKKVLSLLLVFTLFVLSVKGAFADVGGGGSALGRGYESKEKSITSTSKTQIGLTGLGCLAELLLVCFLMGGINRKLDRLHRSY